ncbi:DUF4153 domain-containing protein [Nonomuraea jiangxiensis]|uniref:Signal transduction histidine-protein kinase/phosphatase MprB n=1 Tax=Nonomuraea jiangxiensis TaxID=633440 RepID=A0A1G8ERC4_9ACTN|nr:DUF4153 domain-containing protein [Nonomuraea jiangxiensis]SDH72422.1 Signal transduction histidine kinase [Nonomuraea jiangxiensis]
MRPLDFLGRIKVKLGIVIVLAVGTAFAVNEVGLTSGLSREVRIAVAVVLALIMVQLLAMGMTKPLRQMASAAQTIAKGSYTLRVSATSRDEVGELARAFNAMAADLGEVDRQRRELIANVSHELRTPITGLRAVLENVVDGVSAPDPVTMRTALAQTERLGRLVAQLLDLSRLDSGTRLMEPDTIELAPLVEQAVREAGLAREDVTIRPSVPADLVMRADPDLLAQVLANLLDNAVRHSPPDGVVTVTGEAEGDGVRLVVADRGPGIPVSARGRVFERFSRLDAGRAADSGGAGLGLAIVKEIVELHGGSVRIDDRVGCHMVVDLPGRTTMPDVPLETERMSEGEKGAEQPAPPPPAADPAPARGAPAQAAPVPGVPVRAVAVSGVPVRAVAAQVVAVPGGPGQAGRAEAVGAGSEGPGAAGRDGATEGMVAEGVTSADSGAGPVGGAAPVPVPGYGGPGYGGPVPGYGGPGPAGGGPPSAGGGLARVLGGGVLGVLAGFLVGLFAAVIVSVVAGDGMALFTFLLCVATLGAVGAALGAGSGSRAATTAHQGQATAPYRGQAGPPPPYVPPPLFPRPELPEPPPWLLPAAAGAGVFATVALPDARVGLGVVLVAMVLGAAALPAVLRRMTPWTVAFGVTAYVLISMAAVRDADWLVAVLLVAGAGLGALAVSGAGAGWPGVIRGGVSVLLALGPVPWFLAKPLKRVTSRRRFVPMLVALGITAVLLAVFGLLFASADAVFASYLERVTAAPDWAESVPLRLFLFVLVAVLLAAVVLVALRPVADPVGPMAKFGVSRSIWVLPLTAVNLLFASFVAVQITALFGGNTWVLRTAGLTYAEYARQGFFQLVVVSVFVLGIVAVAAGLLKVERRERWLLAGLLGVLCGLTMVVLASALHRMNLYTDAYGLSRLRLSVQATVWWLGALFTLVLLAGAARLAGRGSGWLPRTIVLVTGLGLAAFAIVNPDLRVAYTQVEVRGVTKLDSDYLGDLGADAVPALDRLPEPLRSCVLADVVAAGGLDRPDPWNGWNLARSQARDLLAARPLHRPVSCGGPSGGRSG